MEQALLWLESDEGDSDYVPKELEIAMFLNVCSEPQTLITEFLPKLLTALAKGSKEEEETRVRAKSLLRLSIAIAVRFPGYHSNLHALHEYLCSNLNTAIHQSEMRFLERLGNCSSNTLFPLYVRPSAIPRDLWQRKAKHGVMQIERKRVVWSRSNELSQDTLVTIFSYLDAHSLCNAQLTCRFWSYAEQYGSQLLWNNLLLARWPEIINGGGKSRYFKRLKLMKTRAAPKLGRRCCEQVIFCPQCDALFTRQAYLLKHTCEDNKSKRKRVKAS